jgi:serine/threonine protein kinase
LQTTFQFDSHYCMVFELLHPSPLVDVVCRRLAADSPRDSLRVIRQITRQLLKALGFLCQQNVIHGDLKPANLLLADGTSLTKANIP